MNQIMSYNKYFGLLAVLLSCIIQKHCIIQNIVLYNCKKCFNFVIDYHNKNVFSN